MSDDRPEMRTQEPIGSRWTQPPGASWRLVGVGLLFAFVLVMLFAFVRDTTRTSIGTDTAPPPATTGQTPR
jgi:hypothetical protein